MAIEFTVSREKTTTLIVFIHGIASNSRAAFTSARSGSFWPEILADQLCCDPSVSIASFNYPTSLATAGFGVEDAAIMLFNDLRGYEFRTLVLVGHSLGGIIARQYVVDFLAERKVRTLVFLVSSPSEGSLLATLFGPFGNLLSHQQIEDLKPGNVKRAAANERFRALIGSPRVRVFVDGVMETALFNIVGHDSSKTFLSRSYHLPLDHITIAKPDRATDPQARHLALFLIDRVPKIQLQLDGCAKQSNHGSLAGKSPPPSASTLSQTTSKGKNNATPSETADGSHVENRGSKESGLPESQPAAAKASPVTAAPKPGQLTPGVRHEASSLIGVVSSRYKPGTTSFEFNKDGVTVTANGVEEKVVIGGQLDILIGRISYRLNVSTVKPKANDRIVYSNRVSGGGPWIIISR